MIELQKQKGIKRTAKIVFLISLLLTIISIIIGILAKINITGWVGVRTIWTFCLRLPIGIIIVLAIVYFGIWLASKIKQKAFKLGNLAGIVYAIILLIGVVMGLELLSNRGQAERMDTVMDAVEEICINGFNDPSTIIKYETGYVVVGTWDNVLVSEDENHNAIWFDNCDPLSACGVVCIRKGIPLEVATINMSPNTEYQYIREGLYRWD